MMYSFTGLEPTKYRCEIPNCNSTDYEGYIEEHEDQSCSYYEAAPDTDGMCQKSLDRISKLHYYYVSSSQVE